MNPWKFYHENFFLKESSLNLKIFRLYGREYNVYIYMYVVYVDNVCYWFTDVTTEAIINGGRYKQWNGLLDWVIFLCWTSFCIYSYIFIWLLWVIVVISQ